MIDVEHHAERPLIRAVLEPSFIQANGIKFHIVQAGDPNGRPLLLLHGFPEFWFGWRHQIDALVDLGYRLIMPDQRGYNLSDHPRRISGYKISTLTRDILEILDALDLPRVSIIAHDWGGIIAWELARLHPGRVDRLININIPHPQVMRQHIFSNPAQRKKSWYIFFFQLPRKPERMLSEDNFRRLKKTMIKTSLPGTFSEKDLNRYAEAWARPGALRGMINWYRAAPRAIFSRSGPRRITVPALLIWGKQDSALGSELARPSIELCDNGELKFVEDATHWVLHEKPLQVNRWIAEFLDAD